MVKIIIIKDGLIMKLFGFIGAGNMGYPLIKAAVKTFGEDEVIYTDTSEQRRQFVLTETKVPFATDNISVVKQCRFLVLAVKPQFFQVVMEEIKPLKLQ
jgi:pyrroline-5-carboxylate reductase